MPREGDARRRLGADGLDALIICIENENDDEKLEQVNGASVSLINEFWGTTRNVLALTRPSRRARS